MTEEQLKRLSSLEKTVKEGLLHPKASAQTVAMVGDVQDELVAVKSMLTKHTETLNNHIIKNDKLVDEHFQADLVHQRKTDKALLELSELLPIVREKLLPAYEREINAENAKKYFKEQAKSGSFWIGVIMSIAGFFYGIIYVLKVFLKP